MADCYCCTSASIVGGREREHLAGAEKRRRMTYDEPTVVVCSSKQLVLRLIAHPLAHTAKKTNYRSPVREALHRRPVRTKQHFLSCLELKGVLAFSGGCGLRRCCMCDSTRTCPAPKAGNKNTTGYCSKTPPYVEPKNKKNPAPSPTHASPLHICVFVCRSTQ